jgi:thioredoxin 1
MVATISSKDFDKEVRDSKIPVIIDFFADWCGPCQMMAPLFEELSSGFKDKLKFVKLDTDEAGGIAEEFGVSSIPCLIILDRGKEIGRFVGFMPKQLLSQKITDTLSKRG